MSVLSLRLTSPSRRLLPFGRDSRIAQNRRRVDVTHDKPSPSHFAELNRDAFTIETTKERSWFVTFFAGKPHAFVVSCELEVDRILFAAFDNFDLKTCAGHFGRR